MNTNFLAVLLARRLSQLYTDYFIRNLSESGWHRLYKLEVVAQEKTGAREGDTPCRLYKSRGRGWDYVAIENANVTVSPKHKHERNN